MKTRVAGTLRRTAAAEAYISRSVGNGSPQEMAEWVEYMTKGLQLQ